MDNILLSTDVPRYITNFDHRYTPRVQADILIIGSGLSSLVCAYELRNSASNILILTKDSITNSNTYLSQGGIATALSYPDSTDKHVNDTINCGHELGDINVITKIINQGKDILKTYFKEGLDFDRSGENFHLGREGGHSENRILHKGDRTGLYLQNYFLSKIESTNIKIVSDTFLIDLLTSDKQATEVLAFSKNKGIQIFESKAIVIASGGIGRLYRETTNSQAATGDGISACLRAGAILQDMEFVQFHPTALYLAGAPRKLLTEALRGAGAFIVGNKCERFLFNYHKNGELAPRDVVARAISNYLAANKTSYVYLDIRHFTKTDLSNFPELLETCSKFSLDPGQDLIPIRPAAHYFIGGVKASICGKTNIESLFVIGESSCTGFHGANRLASNSLLECLVMGYNCAEVIKQELHRMRRISTQQYNRINKHPKNLDIDDIRNSLVSLMLREVGIEREEQGIQSAIDQIQEWKKLMLSDNFDNYRSWELQNMLIVAEAIAISAFHRQESRGVHYRRDYPNLNMNLQKHIKLTGLTKT
ncbi:MAG: L-aspartate oxidase [Planctomycetes bacterium]|nr:L-aspartate oxidase [Planctomycetota bacterium]